MKRHLSAGLCLTLLLCGVRLAAVKTITIPVYFHEITDRHGHGLVSRQEVEDMISALNKAYRGTAVSPPTPFRFDLWNIDIVDNEWWFNSPSECDEWWEGKSKHPHMLRVLHQGNIGTLNIYTVDMGLDGLLGCTGTDATNKDGVVLDYRALRTTVPIHEVAHWFGLDHLEEPNNYMHAFMDTGVEDRFTEAQVAQMCEWWNRWRRP